MSKKAMLVILDGWGHGPRTEWSAIEKGQTNFIDSLYKQYPHSELITYGEEVGLPSGQMGNSEVGHLNIGAGRVVYQELARINKAIRENTLASEVKIQEALAYAQTNGKPIHLIGLVSDGGVHSHINHLIALCNCFATAQVQVYIHAILDGRDTDPHGGKGYLETLLNAIDSKHCKLSSVIGRYYAMDRDHRWERIKKAYDLMVKGSGIEVKDPLEAIQANYDEGITDEFMKALKVDGLDQGLIKDGDAVFFANFRTDRPRQLTTALSQQDFLEFEMQKLDTHFVTMTEYDSTYKNVHPVFTKSVIQDTLGEVVSKAGKTQLRIAETEKYPHVTFFFSGGREEAFEGEDRILIKSPKVATYDLKPEMSAYEVTTAVCESIISKRPELIILNFANADMVGHTGDFNAAIKSVEVLDSCMEVLLSIAKAQDYELLVIADHGNCDQMLNEDGSPHTAHTTNMVPAILITDNQKRRLRDGKLADVAPTLLQMMGLEKPDSMNGSSLIVD